MTFDKDEWSALKGYELVQKMFQVLSEEQELRKQGWADGQYPTERSDAENRGFVQGIEFVINGGFVKESEKGEEDGE